MRYNIVICDKVVALFIGYQVCFSLKQILPAFQTKHNYEKVIFTLVNLSGIMMDMILNYLIL